MAVVKPFCCIRPDIQAAPKVAALPYDVYNRKEACQAVEGNPLSFLNIDRAETQFPDSVSTYDDCVYDKAAELLQKRIQDGTFLRDQEECYYLYRLTMNGRSQTGIVACSSIDDYLQGVIKKHENTREEKELDRIRHVDVTNAQTGPIFLAYRTDPRLEEIVKAVLKTVPLYDFVSEDGIGHQVWRIGETEIISQIEEAFADIPSTYIADGHHRAASAVKVGLKRRQQAAAKTAESGMQSAEDPKNAPHEFFLSVLFPADQLFILPYNRVLKDLNGLTKEAFFQQIRKNFEVVCVGTTPYQPKEKAVFGMYLDRTWYELRTKKHCLSEDPVKGLDVSILQDMLLAPVLGIGDPRTDSRIDFIGGIRGLKELERRVEEDMTVAFSMYPTSIEELFQVADAELLMPPKSTWFEPKLRSGLFLHELS